MKKPVLLTVHVYQLNRLHKLYTIGRINHCPNYTQSNLSGSKTEQQKKCKNSEMKTILPEVVIRVRKLLKSDAQTIIFSNNCNEHLQSTLQC